MLLYRAAALNLGSTDPMGVHEQISGVPEFGWEEKITTLLSLTSG